MVSQSIPRLHKLSGSWLKSPDPPRVRPCGLSRSHLRLKLLIYSLARPAWYSLPSTCGLQFAALRPQTHTHTEEREPHSGKDLEMEFNEKTGQTMLLRHRPWPDQHADQQAVYRQLTPFMSLFFCCLSLSLPHLILMPPFPCLWFLP